MASSERKLWIDVAKALCIFLVFYIHILEGFIKMGNETAYVNLRFIAAFIIQIFIMLSGFVAKEPPSIKFKIFLKQKVFTRVIPIMFFNLILVIPLLTANHSIQNIKKILKEIVGLTVGSTSFNVPTWFLVCFLSMEILHFFAARYLTNMKRIVIAIVLFYTIGWLLTWQINNIRIFGYRVLTFWYFGEAILAYSFYLIGIAINRSGFYNKTRPVYIRLITFSVFTLALLLTFSMNDTFFPTSYMCVDMASYMHGNPFFFLINSIIGSLAVIALSRLMPAFKAFTYIGRNTITLLCIDGVFYALVNYRIGSWITKHLAPLSALSTMLICFITAVIQFALSIPVAHFLAKYFPELLGNIKAKGIISKKATKLYLRFSKAQSSNVNT